MFTSKHPEGEEEEAHSSVISSSQWPELKAWLGLGCLAPSSVSSLRSFRVEASFISSSSFGLDPVTVQSAARSVFLSLTRNQAAQRNLPALTAFFT